MSAGSPRERVAEALHDHGLCVELPGEEGAHEMGAAACHRFADAVLAEVRAWLGSEEAREVVAAATRSNILGASAFAASVRHEVATSILAALTDQTKDAP